MSSTIKIKTLKKSSSNQIIMFRKESHFVSEEKENNSMVILEKENKKLKFNVLDKGFFDKKKISQNLDFLKKELANNGEIISIQRKSCKGFDNPNNTMSFRV